MPQTEGSPAQAAWVAAAYWIGRSQGALFELPRALAAELDCIDCKPPAVAPIEAIVDWLEAAYGGPIDPAAISPSGRRNEPGRPARQVASRP